MMIARAEVIAEARTWLGTPFHHQGRVKGVGVDCAGVVLETARALGIDALDLRGYGHRPDSDEMIHHCRKQMKEVDLEDAQEGDIILIEIDRAPQHLVILTDVGMLHAYAQRRRVVEHVIDQQWRDRFRAAFRLPGVK